MILKLYVPERQREIYGLQFPQLTIFTQTQKTQSFRGKYFWEKKGFENFSFTVTEINFFCFGG